MHSPGSHPSPGLYKPHPWHGLSLGANAPDLVLCYIELVPSDTVKYEMDKTSGYLRIDRPQLYSNVCPTPYGILPRTLCGPLVAARSATRAKRAGLQGDGDPLDICVFTEYNLAHGDILLTARPIGGLRLIDSSQVDDKIIGILEQDGAYGAWSDISDCPVALVDRLKHYFLTYKAAPNGMEQPNRFIAEVYGRDEAHEMIRLGQADYRARFGEL